MHACKQTSSLSILLNATFNFRAFRVITALSTLPLLYSSKCNNVLCCNAVFVHEGFQHMVSNVLVWLALALPLEHAYGTPRILAVWLISALGSAFFSAAFEDSCTLVCSELCPPQHLFL